MAKSRFVVRSRSSLHLSVSVTAMRRVRRHSLLLVSHGKIAITRRGLVDKRIWRIGMPPPVANTEIATRKHKLSSTVVYTGRGQSVRNNYYQCHSVVLLTVCA